MKLNELTYIIAPYTDVKISVWTDDENAEINPVETGIMPWCKQSFGKYEVISIYPRREYLQIDVKESKDNA